MKNTVSGRASDWGESAKEALSIALGFKSDSVYDYKSGTFLAGILALFTWWIPYVGQMIPGYVGGRRAGSIGRGLLCTSIASAVILVIMILLSALLSVVFTDTYANSMEGVPLFIKDSLWALHEYVGTFALVSNGILTINFGSYGMFVVFGMVGGVMAEQSRKEMQIIVANASAASKPAAHRSTVSFKTGQPLGFRDYVDNSPIAVNTTTVPVQRKAPEERKPIEVSVPKESPHVTSVVTNEVKGHIISTSKTTVSKLKEKAVTPKPPVEKKPEEKKPVVKTEEKSEEKPRHSADSNEYF